MAFVAGAPLLQGSLVVQSGVVALSLVDSAIRAGAPTVGWLDVTAKGRSSGEFARVVVYRFIFDDTTGVAPGGVTHADTAYPEYAAAAVPEPSGLGLLARRRRAMAA